jgi:hypothetical protein
VVATKEEVAVIVRKCLLNGGYPKSRWEHKHWEEHPKLRKGMVDGFDDLYKWMLDKIIKPNRGLNTSDLDLDENAHVLETWFGSAWVQTYKVPPEALWYYVNQWWSFFMSEKEQDVAVKIPLYPHALWKRRTDVENPKMLCHLCEIAVRGTRGRHKTMYISLKDPEYKVCEKCIYAFQRPLDLAGRPTRAGNPLFQYKPPPFIPASNRINKKIDEMLNKAKEEDNAPKKKRKKKDVNIEPTPEELQAMRAKLEQSDPEARRKRMEAMMEAPGEKEKLAMEVAMAAKATRPPSPLRGAMGRWGAVRGAVVEKNGKKSRGGSKLTKIVAMARMWKKIFHITSFGGRASKRKIGAVKAAADSGKIIPSAEEGALEAAMAESDDGEEGAAAAGAAGAGTTEHTPGGAEDMKVEEMA